MKPERCFPKARLVRTLILTLAGLGLAVWPHAGFAVELKPETVKAWEQYIGWIDARVNRELASSTSFLIQDRLVAAQKTKLLNQLNAGKVYVDEVRGTVPANAKFEVPEGLIHHWWGSVFVPQMTLKDLLKFLQDYDHHAGKFPNVDASKLLVRQGNYYRFYMRLKHTKAFLTVYYNTFQECTYSIHDQKRVSSRGMVTRIAELENPGTSMEKEKIPGNDRGLLWGLASWWRFQETGAGVIVELESASLSRNIPTLINFIPGVAGYIRATPRESVASVLTSIRSYAGR